MTGIETAMLAGTVASGVMGAAGQAQQGEANAEIQEYNARVAERDAAAARAAAELQSENVRKKNRRILGGARVSSAVSGFEFGGSALEVMADNAAEAELEANIVLYNGEVAATKHESSATLYRRGAANSRRAGQVAAFTTLVGTAGQVAGFHGPIGRHTASGIGAARRF